MSYILGLDDAQYGYMYSVMLYLVLGKGQLSVCSYYYGETESV